MLCMYILCACVCVYSRKPLKVVCQAQQRCVVHNHFTYTVGRGLTHCFVFPGVVRLLDETRHRTCFSHTIFLYETSGGLLHTHTHGLA